MNEIYASKEQDKKHLKVLGVDGRKDRTSFPKNQVKFEEHLTIIDEENYVSHASPSSKAGPVTSKEIVKVIDETESRDTLKVIFTDGEPANTGKVIIHKSCLFQNQKI